MGTARIDTEEKSGVIRRRRNWWLVSALGLAVALAWFGWDLQARQRYRTAMAEIDRQMATGRFGLAARNLEKVLVWRPRSDEAAYLLGICEQTRGRNGQAADAWARVAPGSRFAHRAILARLRQFYDTGRCADAEQLIVGAADDPLNDRSDLRVLLVPIFSQLGRIDEAERLIRDRWDDLNAAGEAATEAAINLLRLHIELSLRPPSVDIQKNYLDQATRAAPDDDRVWLGRANMAIRAGLHDDSRRLLDACSRRRPNDMAVWRARLNWGLATDHPEVVQEALKYLPAADSTPAQLHRWNAWLYSHRSDVESERAELTGLLAVAPADVAALDRLARIAETEGHQEEAAQLTKRKAESERIRARYEQLFDRKQPVRDAEEMAHLAAKLGRSFEARAFLTLAISEEPDRDDLRRELSRLNQIPALTRDLSLKL